MPNFYIKAQRVFTPLRKYAWIFTLMVAMGGLYFPRLGLLVIPVILSLTTLSFFRGRFWCGNICPHGSLFDSLLYPLTGNRHVPKWLKSRIPAALLFTVFSYNLVMKLIRVSRLFGSMLFLDKLGFIFVGSYLMVTIVGGTLSIAFSARTWCQICPMGVLQVLSYRLGKLLRVTRSTDQKITVTHPAMCHICGKCARVCPMQLTPYLEFSKDHQFDEPKCIRCSTCVVNCPAGILSLDTAPNPTEIPATKPPYGYEQRQEITAQLSQIRDLTTDVRVFTFTFIRPAKVSYKPGQFILVKIEDEPKMFRAFSISSQPADETQVSVTVKRVSNGYGSEILFSRFKVGDQVTLQGPMGGELVVDKAADRVLLVAGGIGVTPFLPISQDLVSDTKSGRQVTLVYGANKVAELIYSEVFQKLADEHGNFSYIPVVARDDNWQGQNGFVTDAIRNMNLRGYTVYMCGPKPMTDATHKLLMEMGVKETDIFMESA